MNVLLKSPMSILLILADSLTVTHVGYIKGLDSTYVGFEILLARFTVLLGSLWNLQSRCICMVLSRVSTWSCPGPVRHVDTDPMFRVSKHPLPSPPSPSPTPSPSLFLSFPTSLVPSFPPSLPLTDSLTR